MSHSQEITCRPTGSDEHAAVRLGHAQEGTGCAAGVAGDYRLGWRWHHVDLPVLRIPDAYPG